MSERERPQVFHWQWRPLARGRVKIHVEPPKGTDSSVSFDVDVYVGEHHEEEFIATRQGAGALILPRVIEANERVCVHLPALPGPKVVVRGEVSSFEGARLEWTDSDARRTQSILPHRGKANEAAASGLLE